MTQWQQPDWLPVMTRTSLETAQCGYRYQKIYIEGVKDETEYSIRGTTIHRCNELYVQKLVKSQTSMDMDDAQAAFMEGVADIAPPTQLIPEIRMIWRQHVEKFEFDFEAFIAAEHRRQRREAEVPYEFKPDLEYAHFHESVLEVWDIKTYFEAFSESVAKELVQTRYYMWAAQQEHPGFQWYQMTYWFPRLGRSVSVRFSAEEVDQLDYEIRAMEAARRRRHINNDFTAMPGDVCRFCNLACPVRDDPKMGFMRATTEADRKRIGGLIIVLTKQLSEAKKVLKGSCVVNGPVDVNGVVFANRAGESISYDAAAVVDTMREMGRVPLFTVSKSALESQFKANKGLEAALMPLERRKPRNSFGPKSARDGADGHHQDEE